VNRPYEYVQPRTVHAPRVEITRAGPVVMLHGKPLCSDEGQTTIVNCMVTCCECTKLLSEGWGSR
jgi:hypothetical protein